jgi:FAD/FMN-containing dehydrogenase
VVSATEDENFDLLWASRGGGGNFGVITELSFRLMPIGPMVLGGARFFPIERAPELIRAYRDLMRTAPPELCTGLALQAAPPVAFLPAELHGKPVVGLIVLWAGEPDRAEQGVAQLDVLGEPLADLVDEMPYVALQKIMDEGNPYGLRDYFKGGFISDLEDDAIDAIVRFGNDLRSPLTTIILGPLGSESEYAKATEATSALGHRDAEWTFQVLSIWADPREDDQQIAWTKQVAEAMSSYSSMVSFPNFVSHDDMAGSERAYEPSVLRRLREVKDRWDPGNVFRLNNNILPTVQLPAARL